MIKFCKDGYSKVGEIMSQVGDRIRELREERDWSQREFAKRVGINYSVVNRIELGKRSVEDHELAKIADVFGVTTDYLLGRTDNPNPPEDDNIPEELKAPSLGLFFKELAEAPEERREQLLKIWEILKSEENKRNKKTK
jgi:transcriptional regulator with XRE-family HTH domain